MVKKLLKYDLKSIFRILFPAEVIVLGISLLVRLVQLAKNESVGYSLLLGSSIFLIVSSILVILVMPVILSLVRYYKNMFTAEGYLTHTLPVKSGCHIVSKTTAALIAEISVVITCLVAVIIASCGTPLYNFLDTINGVVKDLHSAAGASFYPLIIEIVIALLVSETANILLYYTCLTMGQLVKKHRLLAAFGFYFAYIAIVQTISTVISVIFTFMLPFCEEAIDNFMSNSPILSAHLIIWFAVLINVILSVICVAVTNGIIKKKLNLE